MNPEQKPPGLDALSCVISSLRDTAHFSDEEGELTHQLRDLRDWALARTRIAAAQTQVRNWPPEVRDATRLEGTTPSCSFGHQSSAPIKAAFVRHFGSGAHWLEAGGSWFTEGYRAALHSDEIRRLRMALTTIRDWPVTNPENMDAQNMRAVATEALSGKPL